MTQPFRVAMLCLAVAAPLSAAAVTVPQRPERYATDRAGVIDAARLRALNERLAAFERETSSQILVYVDRRLPHGTTLEEFANAAFRAWGVGRKDKDNGAVLFVFVEQRKVRFEIGYGLEGAIPDARTVQIRESAIVPRFRQGDYAGGVEQAVEQLMQAARGEPFRGTGQTAAEAGPAEPEPIASWIWLLPLAGLVAAPFAARAGRTIGARVIRGGLVFGIVSAGLAMAGTLVSMDTRFMAVGIGFFLVGASVPLAVAIGQDSGLTGRRRAGLGVLQLSAALATLGFGLLCFSGTPGFFGRLGLLVFLSSFAFAAPGCVLESESPFRLVTLFLGRLAFCGFLIGGVILAAAFLFEVPVPTAAHFALLVAGVMSLVAWTIARSRGWRFAASSGGSRDFSSGGSSSSDSWSSSGDSSFSGGGGDSGGGGSSGDW